MGIWWYWNQTSIVYHQCQCASLCGICAVCVWARSWLISSFICMPLKKLFLFLFQIWWEGECVQLYPAENISDQGHQKSAVGTVSWHRVMAQSYHAKKGPCQNSQVVWLIFFLLLMFSSIAEFLHQFTCPVVLATAMNTLKSWQWMENCSSSDREKDHSTQLSDCCINVRSSNANCDGCVRMMSALHDVSFSSCRSFHPSTPASRQRGH